MTARDAPRQRSVHCDRSEREAIRKNAAAAGKTVSRFLLDLALADDPDRHPLILTEAEQRELLGGVRELRNRAASFGERGG